MCSRTVIERSTLTSYQPRQLLTRDTAAEAPPYQHFMRDLLFSPLTGDATAHLTPEIEAKHDGIKALRLTMASPGLLRASSVAQIHCTTGVPTEPNKKLFGSLYDPRLGHGAQYMHDGSSGACRTIPHCYTCGMDYHNCPGHSGHIELPMVIINPLFTQLVVTIMQTLCVNCCRLRISPYYILAQYITPAATNHERMLRRLKEISIACNRYPHCQFCECQTLVFRGHGLCVHATPTGSPGHSSTPVPPGFLLHVLNRVPLFHYHVLGLGCDKDNHPVHSLLSVIPVAPPIARPSTHNKNNKTGEPFATEDGIVVEYRNIISRAHQMVNSRQPNVVMLAFAEINQSYERIVLDQGRIYCAGQRDSQQPRRPSTLCTTKTAFRRRLVGKQGRIRREAMGKRVNFCARTVATCDSTLCADEISIPLCVLVNVSYPIQVQLFNHAYLTSCMQRGMLTHMCGGHDAPGSEIPMGERCRWRTNALTTRSVLFRRKRRWRLYVDDVDVGSDNTMLLPIPPILAEDAPIAIPPKASMANSARSCTLVRMCLGDRILSPYHRCVSVCDLIVWPTLCIGDVVWLVPQDGDMVLVNRQPTLVQVCEALLLPSLARGLLPFACLLALGRCSWCCCW